MDCDFDSNLKRSFHRMAPLQPFPLAAWVSCPSKHFGDTYAKVNAFYALTAFQPLSKDKHLEYRKKAAFNVLEHGARMLGRTSTPGGAPVPSPLPAELAIELIGTPSCGGHHLSPFGCPIQYACMYCGAKTG